MSKVKLEYIWLDGHQPTQELRSKTISVGNWRTARYGHLTDLQQNRLKVVPQTAS